jgi:hypothetical protein
MCAEAGRDGVGARRLDHNELVNGGTDGQSRSIKHLTVKVIIAETTSETITKTRWGWPLLVAAASINCIGRLTMVPVQGDAVKGARPRLPADEGSHEVAPGPIRLTKRCAPEAMPAEPHCSATARLPLRPRHQMDRDTEALGAGDGWLERLWTDRNLFRRWFACSHHR